MRRTKRALAGVLSVLLLVQTTGCTTWKTVAQPWPTTLTQRPRGPLQIVLREGTTIRADSVRMVADTLLVLLPDWKVDARVSFEDSSWYGRRRGEWEPGPLSLRTGAASFFRGPGADTIPLAWVLAVRVRKVSVVKTMGLILGTAALVAWMVGAVVLMDSLNSSCFFDCP